MEVVYKTEETRLDSIAVYHGVTSLDSHKKKDMT
jgi:hypothetical protein